jgi:YVTN family beta-propeller protein
MNGKSVRPNARFRGLTLIAATAALGLIALIVPAAYGSQGGSWHHDHQQAASQRTASLTTAYVATSKNTVVPISLATKAPGRSIKVPEGIGDPFITSAAASPNGRTVYEVGLTGGVGATVTPISTATNTSGPAITIKQAEPQHFLIAPNGRTAYLTAPEGLFQISTTRHTARKLIDCSRFGCGAMALTPNGKTLYVVNNNGLKAARTVTVMRTANSSVLTRITLPVPDNTPNFAFNIAITPDGKTAYVVDGMAEAKPGANSVVPLNLDTNTALAPIKIQAAGLADGLVIAPGGLTAYVLSSRAVTVIDTATNQAEATISLPHSAGYAYYMALTPNGKTLYVLAPRGVIPIMTATGTVLPTIKVRRLCASTDIAVTPDSKTVYVGACITKTRVLQGHRLHVIVGGGVVPISTATNKPGRFINLGGQPFAITFAR